MSSPEFLLDVPAGSRSIRAVRLFTSAVAKQVGMTPEGVEDLKLAVSEGCNLALSGHGDGGDAGRISMSIRNRGDCLAVEMSLPAQPVVTGADQDDLDAASMSTALIQALYPEAEVVARGAGAVRIKAPFI